MRYELPVERVTPVVEFEEPGWRPSWWSVALAVALTALTLALAAWKVDRALGWMRGDGIRHSSSVIRHCDSEGGAR